MMKTTITVDFRAAHQTCANCVELDIHHTGQQGPSITQKHTLETLRPDVTIPLMLTIVPPRKTLLQVLNKTTQITKSLPIPVMFFLKEYSLPFTRNVLVVIEIKSSLQIFIAHLVRRHHLTNEMDVVSRHAITLKERALLWVYVVEWATVTATLMICGFALWTVMIRRRLYREAGLTRSA